MESKIIIVCGFSGCGKDTIVKYISENYPYKMVISTTSRPIRENESEGNPYNFVSKETFEKMIADNELIEYREYHTLVNNVPDTWYYGVHNKEINLTENNYIVVLDIVGLREFKKKFGENVISFFVDVHEPERRRRAFQNRPDFDRTEWGRRYLDDKSKFTSEVIESEVDYIVDNYDFDKCVKEIMDKTMVKILGEREGYILKKLGVDK